MLWFMSDFYAKEVVRVNNLLAQNPIASPLLSFILQKFLNVISNDIMPLVLNISKHSKILKM